MSRNRRLLLLCLLFLAASMTVAAHPGIGIVMDSRGNVFYTDLVQVWKVTPDGSKSIAVRGVHTHELYLDPGGNLYGEHLWYEGEATNRWGHYLWRLRADGQFEKLTPDLEGFRRDHSFVRDLAGNMYWFEPGPPAAFIRRAPDGTATRLGENASYRDVRWVTAAPDGTLYFTDDGDVRRVSREGTVSTLATALRERELWSWLSYGGWLVLAAMMAFALRWLRPRWLRVLGYVVIALAVAGLLALATVEFRIGDRHHLMGLWLDSHNRVYVALLGAGMVKRYDPATGSVEIVDRSPAPGSPSGGLVAPNGDLWLLETAEDNTVRVRRISPDGNERIF